MSAPFVLDVGGSGTSPEQPLLEREVRLQTTPAGAAGGTTIEAMSPVAYPAGDTGAATGVIETLRNALQSMPPIPNLEVAVAATLGVTPEELDRAGLLGHHSVVGYETAAVYLVTGRAFTMFEANSSGVSYSLTLPIERVRRIGLLEDRERTRLIIEMEADKALTTTNMDENGRSEGTITPAGYEILEQGEPGRDRLRRFAMALNRALAGT